MTDWTNGRLIRDAQLVLRIISGKWTLPLLATLHNGPRRHNDLRRSLASIHPKVFDETLHRMTDQQLLRRNVQEGNPPAVYYELSESARSLMVELGPLLEWANDNPVSLAFWREQI
jgi:DNA-binding HxlR family transcriptional regulator